MREERPASTGEIESLPAVVQGTGTLFVVLLGYAFCLVIPFISGHLVVNLVWTALGGCAGSLFAVGYFLWKPLNLFWDNVYAPKPFAALTPGELRAVAFLNSGRGRLAVLKYVAPVPGAAVFGSVLTSLGYTWPRLKGQVVDDPFLAFLLTAIVCCIFGYPVYCATAARAVSKHWRWIQQNQPLPSPAVLAKYARGKEAGEWAHLYGTQFSHEMDRVLEGRPGKGFFRTMLQILGGGAAALTALRLMTGGVAEGRRTGAVVIMAAGVLIYLLAGIYLSDDDEVDDAEDGELGDNDFEDSEDE